MKLLKTQKWLLIFFGITAIFFGVIGHSSKEKTAVKQATVTLKNIIVRVDVADTSALREKGLSGRASLSEESGMWFVYEKNGIYSFWMPDMHFPIDIIWFDENLRVVYVQKNATPESYPHVFTPDVPARYVLEVPAGFVQKNGVILGDKISAQNTR